MPHASAVVPGNTDTETVAIPANYFNIIKFVSRRDGGYIRVFRHLQLLAEKALNTINTR